MTDSLDFILIVPPIAPARSLDDLDRVAGEVLAVQHSARDPGDEDDLATSPARPVQLFGVGATSAHGAMLLDREWQQAARGAS